MRNSSLDDQQASGRDIGNYNSAGKKGNDPKAVELKRLRQKKDRLEFAVGRLELESK